MRKLRLTVKLLCGAFTRKILWLLLLAFGLISALLFYNFVYFKPPEAIHMTAYSQVILSLIFMTMGIELKRNQQRGRLEDIVAVYEKNSWFYPVCQMLTLTLFAAVTTLVLMAGCGIRMAMDGAPLLWMRQTFAYILLLYFLPCMVMGFWGLLIAQWSKGRGVYLPAILVWLFTSTLNVDLLAYGKNMNMNGSVVLLNMLNMGITSFRNGFINVTMGAPI